MTRKLKTVSIQGRQYITVSERILGFHDTYKNGSISTELVSDKEGIVVIKATVTPDTDKPNRFFTGYSQADKTQGMVNKTSHIENCETSAVGRALGFLGIGIIDAVASVDELAKAGVPTKTQYVAPKSSGPVYYNRPEKAQPKPDLPLTENGAPKF